MPEWFVYLLHCADDTLYCGIAIDVAHRVAEHNEGRGAKYTRARRPCQLLWTEGGHSLSSALKREFGIKRMSRQRKLQLAAEKESVPAL